MKHHVPSTRPERRAIPLPAVGLIVPHSKKQKKPALVTSPPVLKNSIRRNITFMKTFNPEVHSKSKLQAKKDFMASPEVPDLKFESGQMQRWLRKSKSKVKPVAKLRQQHRRMQSHGVQNSLQADPKASIEPPLYTREQNETTIHSSLGQLMDSVPKQPGQLNQQQQLPQQQLALPSQQQLPQKSDYSPKPCDNIQIVNKNQLEILQFDHSMEMLSQSLESSLHPRGRLDERVSDYKRQYMEYFKQPETQDPPTFSKDPAKKKLLHRPRNIKSYERRQKPMSMSSRQSSLITGGKIPSPSLSKKETGRQNDLKNYDFIAGKVMPPKELGSGVASGIIDPYSRYNNITSMAINQNSLGVSPYLKDSSLSGLKLGGESRQSEANTAKNIQLQNQFLPSKFRWNKNRTVAHTQLAYWTEKSHLNPDESSALSKADQNLFFPTSMNHNAAMRIQDSPDQEQFVTERRKKNKSIIDKEENLKSNHSSKLQKSISIVTRNTGVGTGKGKNRISIFKKRQMSQQSKLIKNNGFYRGSAKNTSRGGSMHDPRTLERSESHQPVHTANQGLQAGGGDFGEGDECLVQMNSLKMINSREQSGRKSSLSQSKALNLYLNGIVMASTPVHAFDQKQMAAALETANKPKKSREAAYHTMTNFVQKKTDQGFTGFMKQESIKRKRSSLSRSLEKRSIERHSSLSALRSHNNSRRASLTLAITLTQKQLHTTKGRTLSQEEIRRSITKSATFSHLTGGTGVKPIVLKRSIHLQHSKEILALEEKKRKFSREQQRLLRSSQVNSSQTNFNLQTIYASNRVVDTLEGPKPTNPISQSNTFQEGPYNFTLGEQLPSPSSDTAGPRMINSGLKIMGQSMNVKSPEHPNVNLGFRRELSAISEQNLHCTTIPTEMEKGKLSNPINYDSSQFIRIPSKQIASYPLFEPTIETREEATEDAKMMTVTSQNLADYQQSGHPLRSLTCQHLSKNSSVAPADYATQTFHFTNLNSGRILRKKDEVIESKKVLLNQQSSRGNSLFDSHFYNLEKQTKGQPSNFKITDFQIKTEKMSKNLTMSRPSLKFLHQDKVRHSRKLREERKLKKLFESCAGIPMMLNLKSVPTSTTNRILTGKQHV